MIIATPIPVDQFLGDLDGLTRFSLIITVDEFQRLADDPARSIDFRQGQLDPVFIGFGKGCHSLVMVDFTDLDGISRRG